MFAVCASHHDSWDSPYRGGLENHMLWTLIVVLLVLWALGMLTSFGGGLIHLLLAIAVVVLLVRLISGRRPV
jgi:hypothetical protein